MMLSPWIRRAMRTQKPPVAVRHTCYIAEIIATVTTQGMSGAASGHQAAAPAGTRAAESVWSSAASRARASRSRLRSG